MTANEDTKELILESARKEFLEKGFREASLRSIVKNAGVTTGSFYWHFKNKEELFSAVLDPHYSYLLDLYDRAEERFWKFPTEELTEHMGQISRACMLEMLDYVYLHKAEFQIMLLKAEGTKFANLIHDLTEREIASTRQFSGRMQQSGFSLKEPSPEMEHIIVSGMFAGIFETIIHDFPLETAKSCAQEIHEFYMAGWSHIMQFPFAATGKEHQDGCQGNRTVGM